MHRASSTRPLLLLLAAAALAVPTAARAEEGHFGRRGQFFFGGSSGISLGFTRDTLDRAVATEWYLTLDPKAGYFFHPNGYVGLELSGGYAAESGATLGSVGLGPTVGLRLSMGTMAHFAPNVGVFYEHRRSAASDSGVAFSALVSQPSLSVKTDSLDVRVGLPFLIELRPGFGVTMGPHFSQTVATHTDDGGELAKGTQVTIDFGLVGWI